MKKTFITICTLLAFTQSALANSPINLPTEILQGSTLKIDIPKHNISEVSGSFDGKSINFYEIERKPNWDEPISRGEFLKLLIDNYDLEPVIVTAPRIFPDVPEDHEFFDYIQKAQLRGIIHGYEDGTFGPYDTITRAQIAKILVKSLEPKQIIYDVPEFPDVSPEDWHYDYIHEAAGARYFQGYPDGTMKPNRPINFNEAEIVIKRAVVPQEFKGIDTKNYYRGFVGVHRLTETGTKILKIITDTNHDFPINVIKRDVPVQSFTLPESKTVLFASDKIDNTWNQINGAKANPNPEQLWEGDFIVPAAGTLSLGFGDQLYINGNYSGSHFGLDYANIEGAPIFASNNGIVTLAEETMSYGNTIVIDHGHNVFTMYLHMDKLNVEKGQNVDKGDIIGLMGSTGIATGSHLHFTVFVGDIIVDNYEWYENTF
ncbi:peptidoglycan DD-metalloendopeptidase family protein [Patescibacteria group bacterium]